MCCELVNCYLQIGSGVDEDNERDDDDSEDEEDESEVEEEQDDEELTEDRQNQRSKWFEYFGVWVLWLKRIISVVLAATLEWQTALCPSEWCLFTVSLAENPVFP